MGTIRYILKSLVMLLMFVGSISAHAQLVRGKLTDADDAPVPYASVYVKENKLGTTTNEQGQFVMKLDPGSYTVVFRCLGYETVERAVKVTSNANVNVNVKLQMRSFEIEMITVGKSKEDIAYGTIRKAISMAPYYRNQVSEFRAEVYMKGTVKVKKITRVAKQLLKGEMEVPKAGDVLMQESVNDIHFTAPDRYEQEVKMIRSNIPLFDGNDVMTYLNANFYAPQIADIILPLSPQALKHYNYKYVGYSLQDNRVIDKIKVTPKRKSKQLVEGYIYIADEHFNLHEVDLNVNTVAGTIRVKQTFGEVEKNVWIPVSHHFEVRAKFMGNEADGWYVSSVKYHKVRVNKNLTKPANLLVAEARQEQYDKANGGGSTGSTTTSKASAAASAAVANASATLTRQQRKQQKDAEKLETLVKKDNPTTRDMMEMVKLMEDQAHRANDTVPNSDPREDQLGYYRTTVAPDARTINLLQWDTVRPVVLSEDEKKVDSELKAQVDTTGGKNNIKFSVNPFLKALSGFRWSNSAGNLFVTYSGVLNFDQPEFNTVDGFMPNAFVRVSYFKGSQVFTFYTSAGFGFASKLPRVSTHFRYTYAPKVRAWTRLLFSYERDDFNRATGINRQVNSITSLLLGQNYLKAFSHHSVDLAGFLSPAIGLDVYYGLTADYRKPMSNNTSFIFVPPLRSRYTNNNPINPLIDSTLNLDSRKTTQGSLRILYTPFMHYTRSGDWVDYTKSNFPTLEAKFRFDIPSSLNTKACLFNWEATVRQTLDIGALSKLNYSLTYGDFLRTNNLHFADFKHFHSQRAFLTASEFGDSFQTLDYYTYSTNSYYVQLFANYRSPFMLIKLLPWFSERLWMENLHLGALYTDRLRPYYEVGYSMTRIAALMGFGVFAGFEKASFKSFQVKLSLTL